MLFASRHAEVVAALREQRLETGIEGRALHEAARALHLPADWEQQWMDRFAALPDECDLVSGLAAPMCLGLAASVTTLSMAAAEDLAPVAWGLFDPVRAAAATLELSRHLPDALH